MKRSAASSGVVAPCHRTTTGTARGPPRQPRQRRLECDDAIDEIWVAVGGRQGHIAAIAVTDHHDGSTASGCLFDDLDQIGDLMFHSERPRVRAGPAIAPSVVARHPISIDKPATELQQSGRSVERPVHQHHVWSPCVSCRRRPDPLIADVLLGHWTCTIRNTSAAVEAARVGEPASTTTVSPGTIRPRLSAVSTANQTMSSVVE